MFLRVSVNSGGEFNSEGNYTLTVAGRDVANLNGSIPQAAPLGPGGSGQASVSGHLYWSADDGAINNTDDFYSFTLGSPQKFSSSLTGGTAAAGPGCRSSMIRTAMANSIPASG